MILLRLAWFQRRTISVHASVDIPGITAKRTSTSARLLRAGTVARVLTGLTRFPVSVMRVLRAASAKSTSMNVFLSLVPTVHRVQSRQAS